MKKKIIYLTGLTIITIMLNSCELEKSGNGKLDGFWHLERIDTIGWQDSQSASSGSAAVSSTVNDLSRARIFWAFQHQLLELSEHDGNYATCLCRFSYSGSSLVVNEPYRFDRDNGDEPLTDAELLKPFGVNNIEEHFTVERLTGSKMILSTDFLRLTFTKF